jgi:hypothetical protein
MILINHLKEIKIRDLEGYEINLPAPLKRREKFHIEKLEENCKEMRPLIGKFRISFFPVVEK